MKKLILLACLMSLLSVAAVISGGTLTGGSVAPPPDSSTQMTCAEWVANYSFPPNVTVPTCPELPTTTSTTNINTGLGDPCATMSTALSAGGEHVIVADGTYNCTAGQLSMANDTWLDMGDGVTINVSGTIIWGNDDDIRISGGTISITGSPGYQVEFNGSTDVTVDNVVFNLGTVAGIFVSQSTIVSRFAFLYNEVTSGTYSLFTQAGAGITDAVIAGNDMLGGESGAEATVRIQDGLNILIARNRVRNILGYNYLFRLWAGPEEVLLVENYVETTNGGRTLSISSDCVTRPGQTNDVYATGNHWYNSGGTQAVISALYESGCGATSACTTVDLIDNFQYNEPAASSFVVANDGFTSCTDLTTSGNSLLDYSDSGGIPTCATIGCGPDH